MTHFLPPDSHLLLFYTVLKRADGWGPKLQSQEPMGDISHSNRAQTKADVVIRTVSEITVLWVCDLKAALPTSVFSKTSITCWFASEWEGGCEFSEGVWYQMWAESSKVRAPVRLSRNSDGILACWLCFYSQQNGHMNLWGASGVWATFLSRVAYARHPSNHRQLWFVYVDIVVNNNVLILQVVWYSCTTPPHTHTQTLYFAGFLETIKTTHNH